MSKGMEQLRELVSKYTRGELTEEEFLRSMEEHERSTRETIVDLTSDQTSLAQTSAAIRRIGRL